MLLEKVLLCQYHCSKLKTSHLLELLIRNIGTLDLIHYWLHDYIKRSLNLILDTFPWMSDLQSTVQKSWAIISLCFLSKEPDFLALFLSNLSPGFLKVFKGFLWRLAAFWGQSMYLTIFRRFVFLFFCLLNHLHQGSATCGSAWFGKINWKYLQ